MSERIEVGCLVAVVKQHCEQADSGGVWSKVAEMDIATTQRPWRCSFCGGLAFGDVARLPAVDSAPSVGWLPVAYLKRINPPPISQSIETREEMTA